MSRADACDGGLPRAGDPPRSWAQQMFNFPDGGTAETPVDIAALLAITPMADRRDHRPGRQRRHHHRLRSRARRARAKRKRPTRPKTARSIKPARTEKKTKRAGGKVGRRRKGRQRARRHAERQRDPAESGGSIRRRARDPRAFAGAPPGTREARPRARYPGGPHRGRLRNASIPSSRRSRTARPSSRPPRRRKTRRKPRDSRASSRCTRT